jgi:hypothetical protein
MHRLVETAARAACGIDFRVKPGERGWTVWRRAPTGWVWNADFAVREDAEDYLVCKLAQEDR